MASALSETIDIETRVSGHPAGHEAELRLWLRMLTCTTLIETGIRRRLRDEFEMTLPRFDLLAQLDKAKTGRDGGMTLGELSRRMMVSNGNVTAIVEALLEQGLIDRRPSPQDRRTQLVRLTPQGRRAFARLAAAHAEWMAQTFAGLSAAEMRQLMTLLAKTKASARAFHDLPEAEAPVSATKRDVTKTVKPKVKAQ